MLPFVPELQPPVVSIMLPLELQMLPLVRSLGRVRVALVPALVLGIQAVVVPIVSPFQAGVMLVVAGLQPVVQ